MVLRTHIHPYACLLIPDQGGHDDTRLNSTTTCTIARSPSKEFMMPTKFNERDWKCINTIRTLAIDMVQAANSGHPGAPLGLAPMVHVLASRVLKHGLRDYVNRDRFVLSNGHACAVQYSMFQLLGVLKMEDIKAFRQVDSRTPGHPESHITPGVEVTTGPLGQGFANAVGLVIAQSHLAATYGEDLFDSHTFVIMGDGCMMEGITSEAASLAGHLKLSKLIAIYDDNKISIDGPTSLAFTEDVGKRFEAYGFKVLRVHKGDDDLEGMLDAIEEAKKNKDSPTLIILSTTIGKYSRGEGTAKVHGSPLGAEDVARVKTALGFDPSKSFVVDEDVRAFYSDIAKHSREEEQQWKQRLDQHSKSQEIKRVLKGELPKNWKASLPTFKDEKMATRKASELALNALGQILTGIVGGSADLTPSTLTLWKGALEFGASSGQHGEYAGRYIRFGVREHAMFAICNGIAAHSLALRPFASTFLNFITYGYGAVRLSALSHLPVLYIMTHDSIGLGEDGPTHQPIEVLPLIRATPNISLWRPADGNEVAAAYEFALETRDKPTVLALSRQSLPPLPSDRKLARRGAYILHACTSPDLIIIATGSEVAIAMDSLPLIPHAVRVVSIPSWDQFEAQSVEYRQSVLTPTIPVLSVEAASPLGWSRYAHHHVAMNTFGASGPYEQVYTKFGFTKENVAAVARKVVERYTSEECPVLPCISLDL